MSKFKRCFIAEKKSLGTEVAQALGKQKGIKPSPVNSSHFVVGDDVVTWFRGHVYENSKPDAYGYKFGDLSQMPVIKFINCIRYQTMKIYNFSTYSCKFIGNSS